MSEYLKDKLEKINSILSSTDAEILEMMTDAWKEGIKSSPLYKIWDKKDKTEEQSVVEVLRCQLESLKSILQIFSPKIEKNEYNALREGNFSMKEKLEA